MKLFAAAALLAALPTAAAAGTALPRPDYLCSEAEKPFFMGGPGGLVRAAREGAHPETFLMPKPAGLRRIFLVGESAAAVLGSGAGLKFNGAERAEVINCGMGAYDPRRTLEVLRETLRYSPDLVVVFSGNNAALPETCGGAKYELLRRRRRLLERWHAVKGAADPGEAAARDLHASALAAMAAAARAAGVPLVFAALPANSADMPPEGPPPLQEASFAAGWRAYYSGDHAGAAASFAAGTGAYYSFYLGKALAAAGRRGEALPHFLDALEKDAAGGRSGPGRNAVVRRQAAAGGACVAALDGLFLTAAGGAPGFGQFRDGAHWLPEFNAAVLERALAAGADCGAAWAAGLKPAAGPRSAPGRDPRVRLSYAAAWIGEDGMHQGAVAQLERLLAEAPRLLAGASSSPRGLASGLIANEWVSASEYRAEALFPHFLAHLAEARRRRGDFQEALSLLDRAANLRPGLPHFALARAEILAGLGRRREAAAEFSALASAPPIGGESRGLGFGYGRTLPSIAGRTRQAAPLRLPEVPGPRAAVPQSCRAARVSGGASYALAACQAAAADPAAGPQAQLELVELYLELGRREEAAAAAAWLLETAPEGWAGKARAGRLLESARTGGRE